MSDPKDRASGSIGGGPRVRRAGPVLAGLLLILTIGGCGGPEEAPDALDTQPDEAEAVVTRGPRVRVVTALSGASPEEVEQSVTSKVEAAVMGLESVAEVRSTSRQGVSTVDVEFLMDARADDAMAAVRRVVATIYNSLPAEAGAPEITARDQDPVVACVVVGGDVAHAVLSSVADELRDGFREIPGVTRVDLVAARSEVRIEVAPERLSRFGLSPDDLLKAVEAGSQRHTDLREVVVGLASNGEPIRLADVARIVRGLDGATIVHVDGSGGALLLVHAAEGEDAAVVQQGARGVIARRESRVPAGVRARIQDWTPAGRKEAPILRVAVDCPGLSVDHVEGQVAAALESGLAGIEGVAGVCTVSSSGRCVAQVAFERGTGRSDARARLRAHLADQQWPGMELTVEPIQPVSIGRLEIGGTATVAELSRVAQELRLELRTITGIARVDAPALAPMQAELQMVLKPEVAAKYGLTLKDVTDFVRSSSYGPGAVIDSASGPLRIVTVGSEAPGEIGRLQIPIGGDHHVPLAKLVEMKMTRRRAAIGRVDGHRCITLEIFGDGSEETSRTVERVRSLVASFVARGQAGQDITVRFEGES